MKIERILRDAEEYENEIKTHESSKLHCNQDELKRYNHWTLGSIPPSRICYCRRLRTYAEKISKLSADAEDGLMCKPNNNLTNELNNSVPYATKRSLMLNEFIELTDRVAKTSKMTTTTKTTTTNDPGNRFQYNSYRRSLQPAQAPLLRNYSPATVSAKNFRDSFSNTNVAVIKGGRERVVPGGSVLCAIESVLPDGHFVNVVRSVALYWFFCLHTVLAKGDVHFGRTSFAFPPNENVNSSSPLMRYSSFSSASVQVSDIFSRLYNLVSLMDEENFSHSFEFGAHSPVTEKDQKSNGTSPSIVIREIETDDEERREVGDAAPNENDESESGYRSASDGNSRRSSDTSGKSSCADDPRIVPVAYYNYQPFSRNGGAVPAVRHWAAENAATIHIFGERKSAELAERVDNKEKNEMYIVAPGDFEGDNVQDFLGEIASAGASSIVLPSTGGEVPQSNDSRPFRPFELWTSSRNYGQDFFESRSRASMEAPARASSSAEENCYHQNVVTRNDYVTDVRGHIFPRWNMWATPTAGENVVSPKNAVTDLRGRTFPRWNMWATPNFVGPLPSTLTAEAAAIDFQWCSPTVVNPVGNNSFISDGDHPEQISSNGNAVFRKYSELIAPSMQERRPSRECCAFLESSSPQWKRGSPRLSVSSDEDLYSDTEDEDVGNLMDAPRVFTPIEPAIRVPTDASNLERSFSGAYYVSGRRFQSYTPSPDLDDGPEPPPLPPTPPTRNPFKLKFEVHFANHVYTQTEERAPDSDPKAADDVDWTWTAAGPTLNLNAAEPRLVDRSETMSETEELASYFFYNDRY